MATAVAVKVSQNARLAETKTQGGEAACAEGESHPGCPPATGGGAESSGAGRGTADPGQESRQRRAAIRHGPRTGQYASPRRHTGRGRRIADPGRCAEY